MQKCSNTKLNLAQLFVLKLYHINTKKLMSHSAICILICLTNKGTNFLVFAGLNKTEIKFQGQSLKFLRNYKFYLGRKFYKNNQICATKEKRNNVRSDEKEKIENLSNIKLKNVKLFLFRFILD